MATKMYGSRATRLNERQTAIGRRHEEHNRPNSSATLSHKLWPCRDAWDCTLRDSLAHTAKYSHPCPFADRCNKKAMEPNLTHEPNLIPQCDYDANCRKMDDPRHRASFRHSNKPDFLKVCRDHPRCSNSSYEHRSKFSHGEYKSIFNPASPSSHSQDHSDRRHPQRKGQNEHTTRRPANSTINNSPKQIGRHRSLSAGSSSRGGRRSLSRNSQRRADSKGKSPISPHGSRRKSSRSSRLDKIAPNTTEKELPNNDGRRSPGTPSRKQSSPNRHQRSKSGDRISSQSTRTSGRSPSGSFRSPLPILRHARQSRSSETGSGSNTSLNRRSLSRSESN